MSEANLLTQTGILTRQQLALIPTPTATRTHQPVPHSEVVEAVITTLGLRKIGVVAEQYTVDKTGMKMWGTLDLEAMEENIRFSIGLRNSNDKTMSLSLIAGYRVMVCSNGCFSELSGLNSNDSSSANRPISDDYLLPNAADRLV